MLAIKPKRLDLILPSFRFVFVSFLSLSDGQNQIAIRFNRDLNRIDDLIET